MKKKSACCCKCCCSNTSGVIKCGLVVFPSWHCFRNPDALDPRFCLGRNTRYPVVIEEDTRRAVARHRLEIWLWVLLDNYRAGLQLLLPQVCEICLVIYQEQNKWWDNMIFTIRVLSRLTALLTWAASLGWTFAVLLQHLQGILRTCSKKIQFLFLFLTLSSYFDFARPVTQIVFHIRR